MKKYHTPKSMRYGWGEAFMDELCAFLAAPFKMFGYLISELPNVIWRKEKYTRKFETPSSSKTPQPMPKVSGKPNVEE